MLEDPSDTAKLMDNNTIYVSYKKLEEFTRDFLPQINTTFVLITIPFGVSYPTGIDLLAPKIAGHKNLLHWFATNIGNYTGGYQFHPQISPFPLGLKPKMTGLNNCRWIWRNPVPYYRNIFLETMNTTNTTKTNSIFVGYLSRTHDDRKNVPSGRKLPYETYLRKIAESSYVISPNGIRPDCHRHYEAIGLGSVPITAFDPYLYSHL